MTPERDWIDYLSLGSNIGAGLGGVAAAVLAFWAVRLQYLAAGKFAVAGLREAAVRWRRDHVEVRLALVFLNSGARPVLIENLRLVMTGASGPVELAYATELQDLTQPDAHLPFPRSAFANFEDVELGVERRASAIIIGGYGGERRVCGFHAPGDVVFVAGRHRLTLEMRRPGKNSPWEVIGVISVELPRERFPQSDGYMAPVVVPAIEGER